MGSTIYTEVFVLALVLISNVLGNNFVGYIPRTATEIAARLQVPAPKLLLQVRKFRQQMSLKYRVRAPSVFRHPLSLRAARLLKPSPVRRGLQPSQTGTVRGAIHIQARRTADNARAPLHPPLVIQTVPFADFHRSQLSLPPASGHFTCY